ncbi:hypothetical protein DIC82_11365 [Clostridium beijerinckii]|nr:hypothetical protein DIC82_11365 [Clostridium beijerinckii]
MATNKSLKRDLNNIAGTKEEISLNKKDLDLNKDEINFNTEETDLNGKDNMLNNETVVASFNVVENGIMKNIEKSEVATENKEVINEEADDSMNLKIFKNYMDLCRKTGLIPSWTELNKFKQYYIG